MVAISSDDTYSLEEIAEVTGIPPSTAYRWRSTGQLLTIYDFQVDPDMMKRIVAHLRADPANATKPLPGAMPVTRFFLEDAVRMLLIGHLGSLGWDRTRLFDALAVPYAIHIDRGREPRFLVLYPDGAKLDRVAVNAEQELHRVLAVKPLATVIDLDAYRAHMLKSLAAIIEVRDRKAAALEARAREQGRFVKEKA
jgi:hypothetical protein